MVSIMSLSTSAGQGQSVCLSPSDQEEDVNVFQNLSQDQEEDVSMCFKSLRPMRKMSGGCEYMCFKSLIPMRRMSGGYVFIWGLRMQQADVKGSRHRRTTSPISLQAHACSR